MTVTAVCLYADQPHFIETMLRCFRSQTYQDRKLLVYSNGALPPMVPLLANERVESGISATVGQLRNAVNALTQSEILLHADLDDFSHPSRIAEQVALLQSSGADCVGYNEMLFWREARQLTNADVYGLDECLRSGIEPRCGCDVVPGEAWLYSNPNPSYVLGTSMAYWRKAWEARPFEATSQGEDVRWCAGVRCLGISAVDHPPVPTGDVRPRMIARIHAGQSGNTSNAYKAETMQRASEWGMAPEWDSYCRSVFEETCPRL